MNGRRHNFLPLFFSASHRGINVRSTKRKNMNLFIKNMVCNRCKAAVKTAIQNLGITPVSVELGEVVLESHLNADQLKTLETNLQSLGFEVINDKRSTQIEKIKTLIVDLVHYQQTQLHTNLSDYLAEQLQLDYNSLSKLFSEVENTTIEQYYIAQKIEKIKELIMYDERSLSEIADMLHYSSLAHMSNQFKKVTGLSPSHYKKLKNNKRKQIDKL
jgi:AraC-like DNA-binding protein